MNPDQNLKATKPNASDEDTQRSGPDKKSDANPDQSLEPTTVSGFQLAMLAATIHPEACRGGNSRDALLGALALLMESEMLCTEIPKTPIERLNWLEENGALFERGGANRLYHVLSHAVTKPAPPFTLAMRDKDEDSLREHLAKKLNLEGKKSGRPAWGTVRTVLDNFRWMFVDHANAHNKRNAARIQDRNERDEAEAQRQGISAAQLRNQGGHIFHDEEWRDGEAESNDFLERRARQDASGKVVRYEIERSYAERLIAWKKKIKRSGGVKKVHPLTPDEVFGKVPKKKIPKKVK